MADDKRQLTTRAREVINDAYARGVEAGKEQGYGEGLKFAARQALLETQAQSLEHSAGRVEDEPAQSAFREAAALLRDLASQSVKAEADGKPKRVKRQSG